jgi:hypothetical protein
LVTEVACITKPLVECFLIALGLINDVVAHGIVLVRFEVPFAQRGLYDERNQLHEEHTASVIPDRAQAWLLPRRIGAPERWD